MLKYVVIGGVNGAGKSTLYISEPNMWKLPDRSIHEIKQMVRLTQKQNEKCREE